MKVLGILLIALAAWSGQGVTVSRTDLGSDPASINKIFSIKGKYFFMAGPKLYTEGQVLDTLIAKPTDFDCFETKDICVVVSNLEAKLITHTPGAFKVDEKIFKFDPNFKPDPDAYYYSKVAAIRFSTYFLLGVSSKLDLQRWEITDNNKMHSLVIAQSFSDKDKYIRDIFILGTTPYAFLSVFGFGGLLQFDYTQMTIKKYHSSLPSGLMAPMDLDMSLSKCVLAHQDNLSVANYATGELLDTARKDYFIAAVAGIYQSDFILVAEDTMLKIYNAGVSLDSEVLKYNLPDCVSSVFYDTVSSQVLVSGFKFASKLVLGSPTNLECHNNCQAPCTRGFSPASCSACLAPSTGTALESATVCKRPQTNPDAILDLASITWSSPKELTPPSTEGGFFDTLMTKYKLYVLIGGGLVAFFCLCCIFKSCCCSKDPESQAQSNQANKRGMNRVHDQSSVSGFIEPAKIQ